MQPGHLLESLSRRHVADRRMPTSAVIVALDPPEQCSPGVFAGCEAGAVDEFALHRAEEAFHRRVVQAITLAAHGRCQTVAFQDRLVRVAGILHPAVTMVGQASWRLTALDRHEQGSLTKLGAQVVVHRPADDLAGRHILDGGDIQPAFAGRDIR